MEPEEMLEERLERLRSASTILLSIGAADYSAQVLGVMKSVLLRKKGDAVYVTFNRSVYSLSELFKSIEDCKNRLLFLDAVSLNSGERGAELENAFFIPFPGDLTGLMIVLSRTFKMHDFKFLFLDSVPSVLIYNDEKTTTRFIYALSSLCKQHSVNLVLLSSSDLSASLTSSLSGITGQQTVSASA